VSLLNPNNRLENFYMFLFARLQLSSQKKLFLGRKNVGGGPPITPVSSCFLIDLTESVPRNYRIVLRIVPSMNDAINC
jgi:hypothetical protein